MSQSPHQFEESHPRPRIGWVRRVSSAIVLLLLCAIIGGYWFVTDSRRVRRIAQDSLRDLVGARVEIQRASLSIFEGLRLEGVRVFVDDANAPDSCIFSAKTLLVTASLKTLTTGRMDTSEITAVQPQVRLCEDVDRKQWNYERVRRTPHDKPKTDTEPSSPMTFPEVFLRAGVVEYSRIEDGRHVIVGRTAIDGHLLPQPGGRNRYTFDLDSRPPGQADGPRLRGTLDMDRLAVSASLDNVEFGESIAVMLPSQVQAWWRKHQLAGRVRITEMRYTPARKDFRVVLEAEQVGLTIWPEEMMDEWEYQAQKRWRPGIRTNLPNIFPLAGVTDSVARVMGPRPVRLTDVAGRFTFTPDGISISSIRADFEGNRIMAMGNIKGYSEHAPLDVFVLVPQLNIPRLPTYIWSLPFEAREIWADFRPHGAGRLTLHADRREPGGKIRVEVLLDVLDGAFTFHDFPYPLRQIRGQLWFGQDATTGQDRVEFRNFVGQGAAGTENENTTMTLSGWISPLGKRVGLDLRFASRDCRLDPLLRQALPEDARDVVASFDTVENGRKVPVQLHADFEARVRREQGLRKRVNVDVDLDVHKASGAFSGFPYPLRTLQGRVEIHPFSVDLKNLRERKGDALLTVNGTVSWGKDQPVTPDLTVRAENVPIDDDLLRAMPPAQRRWLTDAGVGGRLNIHEGRIYLERAAGDWTTVPGAEPDVTGPTEVGFSLDIQLADGRISILDQPDAITGIAAEALLTNNRLTLERAGGWLGDAEVMAHGSVSWPDGTPKATVFVGATAVHADERLFNMISQSVRQTCKSLRPSGTLDISLNYASAADATGAGAFKIELRPRELSLRPEAFDWDFQDLKGLVTITQSGVSFDKVSARHDSSAISLGGSGSPDNGWDLSLKAGSLPVDEQFLAKLPEAIRGFLKTISLKGTMALDLTRLNYRPASTTRPSAIEFAGSVGLTDASMDVGLAITGFNGSLSLDGLIEDGEIRQLTGSIDASSAVLAERPMKNIHGRLVKLKNQPSYRFEDLGGTLAGGRIGGVVLVAFPKNKPVMYEVSMAMNDIDVRQFVADPTAKFRGRMKASLDLAGNASDPNSRRGRGFIDVEGEDLYELPAITGLLQITNMALPIKSPFNNASARYAVLGKRVIFEEIELIAPDMVMRGTGQLDYGQKSVSIRFTTSNPNWLNVPIIQLMKNEANTIDIEGTIKEPQIKARSMINFTTTIDKAFKPEVKRGSDKPKDR
ncbi:MAG: DUF3971 domain-containing protein [Tepidisphaerales bacterium]